MSCIIRMSWKGGNPQELRVLFPPESVDSRPGKSTCFCSWVKTEKETISMLKTNKNTFLLFGQG